MKPESDFISPGGTADYVEWKQWLLEFNIFPPASVFTEALYISQEYILVYLL